MLKRETVRAAADALAVATGLSFVASAVVQEAIFALWGLDFTAIASVEDVILGGIRFLSILIALSVMILPLFIVIDYFDDELLPPRTRVASWIRNGSLTAILFSGAAASMYTRFRYGTTDPEHKLLRTAIMAGALCIALPAIVLLTSSVPLRAASRRLRQRGKFSMWLLAAAVFTVIVNSAMSYMSPYSSLEILAGHAVPAACLPEGPNHPKILWIGTRSIVIDCGSRRTVLKTGESPYALSLDR